MSEKFENGASWELVKAEAPYGWVYLDFTGTPVLTQNKVLADDYADKGITVVSMYAVGQLHHGIVAGYNLRQLSLPVEAIKLALHFMNCLRHRWESEGSDAVGIKASGIDDAMTQLRTLLGDQP